MQPTHVKWEHIPTPSEHLLSQKQQQEQRPDTATLTNGVHPATNNENVPSDSNPDRPSSHNNRKTIFAPVPDLISRNYLISDTYFETPSSPSSLIPGPDGDITDLGPNGLSSISQSVLDELPADCRAAFATAKNAEMGWKNQWGDEGSDGGRGRLRIGFNGFPV